MKILYVNSTRRWGGVKSWCLRSARALTFQGHEVLMAGRAGDPFLDACRDAGLPVLPLAFGASWSPALILRFVRLIRAEAVQLTVCNTGRDLSTAGAASRLCGVPVVHRVGSGVDFRDTWARRRTHAVLVTRVLAPAHVVGHELGRRFPWVLPGQVLVSWNAAETLREHPPGQPDRVVCLARLAAGKGLETLLAAMAMLKEKGRHFQLDLVGEGPLEQELRAITGRLGLEGMVRFPGFVRPCGDILSLATIGVLPSEREGFPNTLLEYWAAGLAVVSSDLPGVREAVGDSGAALLVPPRDAEALAAALQRVLTDPALRQRLSADGLDRVRSTFGTQQEAVRLEQIYGTLIGGGR